MNMSPYAPSVMMLLLTAVLSCLIHKHIEKFVDVGEMLLVWWRRVMDAIREKELDSRVVLQETVPFSQKAHDEMVRRGKDSGGTQ